MENVEMIAVDRLTPSKANARTHSRKQIRQIADSISRFGFCNPILIDDAGQIIAGHGRVEAAKLLDLKAVPALRLPHLSAAEKRAYVLADNRLAELAGWDCKILATELQGLVDLDFEVELTGFDIGDIDIVLADADEPVTHEGETPARLPAPTISQVGDLWLLGQHRLHCGDTRDNGADVAIRHWQSYTGKTATLAATGQTFEQIEDQRAGSKVRHEIAQRKPVEIEETR